MRKSLVFIRLVLLCNAINLTSAIVHLKSLSTWFTEAPATFAVGVNRSGICGALHVADPLDACSSLSLLNEFGYEYDGTLNINFVLISRGKCSFEDKIRHAQRAGFRAAIVYDDQDKHNLVSMMGSSKGIWMHAVFVSNAAGETLKKHARAEEGECCIALSVEETAWTVLVISVISLLVMISVLVSFVSTRYHRRTSHNFVDGKVVGVLPCFTFSTAHQRGYTGEACTICLEEYKAGENLKVLPCQHDFHARCVDLWLTNWGTFCPVCKHDMKTAVTYSEASDRRPLLSF